MTTHKGNSGVVRVGGTPTAIAEINTWSVTETAGTVETTALGDTARTYESDDLPTWTASVNCHYFPGDTTGQDVCLIGQTLDFEFSSQGVDSGKKKMTGSGIITTRQVGEVANGAVVPLALQIQGAGALVHGSHT